MSKKSSVTTKTGHVFTVKYNLIVFVLHAPLGTQGDMETGRQGDMETGRQEDWETERQGDKETWRQGDWETGRQ